LSRASGKNTGCLGGFCLQRISGKEKYQGAARWGVEIRIHEVLTMGLKKKPVSWPRSTNNAAEMLKKKKSRKEDRSGTPGGDLKPCR